MQLIPDDILAQYEAALKTRAVPVFRHAEYRKWLRYYLDFRSKYPLPDSQSGQVRAFIEKLRKKNQSHEQQKQAAHAVSLFFESQLQKKHVSPSQAEAITPTAPPLSDRQRSQSVPETKPATLQQVDIPPPRDGYHQAPDSQSSSQSPVPRVSAGKRYHQWRSLEKSGSPDWDTIIDSLAAEITTRHYSRKTLKAYADWSRKFQGFLRNKPPGELSAVEVKSYLTHLAVTCHVAASTQNQAFNALLFLYRHILKKDFGDHKDIPRACR
jgi:site-specific recombinase XerD